MRLDNYVLLPIRPCKSLWTYVRLHEKKQCAAHPRNTQSPYSPRTVPVQSPYSPRTVPEHSFLMSSRVYKCTRIQSCTFSMIVKHTHGVPASHEYIHSNRKMSSGIVRGLYGDCTGIVRGLYGDCMRVVKCEIACVILMAKLVYIVCTIFVPRVIVYRACCIV